MDDVAGSSSPTSVPGVPAGTYARGIVGAVVGAAAGAMILAWGANNGFYAPLIVGGLTGIGCAMLSRRSSLALGVFCGVFGLLATVATDWRVMFPNRDLMTFITQVLPTRGSFIYALWLVSGLIAYVFGRGQDG